MHSSFWKHILEPDLGRKINELQNGTAVAVNQIF